MARSTRLPVDDPGELPEDLYVSTDEARRMFDEATRRITGMRGKEFIRRYKAGEEADMVESEDDRHIVGLVPVIPLARWARTAREAVGEFTDGFTRLVGCVTDRPLHATSMSAWAATPTVC